MHYRELGKSGVMVSEVGLGGNRLGQEYASDDFWRDLIYHAVELGITVFDTAEAYEWGRSEEMLGLALGNRDDVVVATKMCRIRETGEQDYTAERMMKTVEGSLRRLRRDVIDIYQLHSPRRESMERDNWAEGMAKLKAQGKIRLSAVAVNSAADGIWLMEQDLVDVLQITYNIFDIEVENKLLPLAEKTGVGLLCRMPLARGVLTGKFHLGQNVPAGHRALLDGDEMWDNVRKADQLRPIAEDYEGSMTRIAHHFSLTPRAVSAIIPGARTLKQVEENASASNGTGLPADIRREIMDIRAAWE
ncbi:MAG: aldo/keto reductase [Anaerolineales bacterium]|nr:MAG: aldo/keto reductase [Anaerolineales bacterium]